MKGHTTISVATVVGKWELPKYAFETLKGGNQWQDSLVLTSCIRTTEMIERTCSKQ